MTVEILGLFSLGGTSGQTLLSLAMNARSEAVNPTQVHSYDHGNCKSNQVSRKATN